MAKLSYDVHDFAISPCQCGSMHTHPPRCILMQWDSSQYSRWVDIAACCRLLTFLTFSVLGTPGTHQFFFFFLTARRCRRLDLHRIQCPSYYTSSSKFASDHWHFYDIIRNLIVGWLEKVELRHCLSKNDWGYHRVCSSGILFLYALDVRYIVRPAPHSK